MNPFAKAIAEVRYSIPEPILQRAFIEANRYGRTTWRSSLEEQILATVIIPKVMVDCNLVGGIEAFIPLEGIEQITTPETSGGVVMFIPKDRTQQKSITAIIDLRFSNPIQNNGAIGAGAYGYSPSYMTGLNTTQANRTATMSLAAGLLASVDNIPLVGTTRVDLIGENTIHIADTVRLPNTCVLHCKLSNHEDMLNLNARYYIQFAKLVIFAVKAYIYNRLIIEIGKGELMYGFELGKFKEIVESYADAYDNYNDYLRNKWAKISVMNDRGAYTRQIMMRIGGNR